MIPTACFRAAAQVFMNTFTQRSTLEELDRVLAQGIIFRIMLAAAGYGVSTTFCQALTARGPTWAVGIIGQQKVFGEQVTVTDSARQTRNTRRPRKHDIPSKPTRPIRDVFPPYPTGPFDPENAVEDRGVIQGRTSRSRTLRWEQWRQLAPLLVRPFTTPHSCLWMALCGHHLALQPSAYPSHGS